MPWLLSEAQNSDVLRCLSREHIDMLQPLTKSLRDGSFQLTTECLRSLNAVTFEGVYRLEEYKVYVSSASGKKASRVGDLHDVLGFLRNALRTSNISMFRVQYSKLSLELLDYLKQAEGESFVVHALAFKDVDFRDVNPQLFHETMLSLPSLAVLTIDGGEMLSGHITDDFLGGCREHAINELLVWPDYFRDGSERFEVSDAGIIRFCDRDSSATETTCRLCLRYANVSPEFTSKMIEIWRMGELADALEVMVEPVYIPEQALLHTYNQSVTRVGYPKTVFDFRAGGKEVLRVVFNQGPHALVLSGHRPAHS
ncbi:hypothetical protein AAVH_13664 [Aphelenchoides avenae]|nr:hypothetical protein AAVH_13664 [Aphelenchus avenae]